MVSRWSTRMQLPFSSQPTRRGVILNDLEFLFVPCHISNNHWALIIVDFRARIMYYLDSLIHKQLPLSKNVQVEELTEMFEKFSLNSPAPVFQLPSPLDPQSNDFPAALTDFFLHCQVLERYLLDEFLRYGGSDGSPVESSTPSSESMTESIDIQQNTQDLNNFQDQPSSLKGLLSLKDSHIILPNSKPFPAFSSPMTNPSPSVQEASTPLQTYQPFTFIALRDIPNQENSYDCGPFTCINLAFVVQLLASRKDHPDKTSTFTSQSYSAHDVSNFRLYLTLGLVNHELPPLLE